MSDLRDSERRHSYGAQMRKHFPESQIDNLTRFDGAVEFYTRVNALVKPEMTLLDFGGGRGHWISDVTSETRRDLRNFRGRVAEVIGADVDDAILSNPSVDRALVIDPQGTIPLSDESVDLVISDFTFEHVQDPEWTAKELGRILRPGGWICARTPNKLGYVGIMARVVPNSRHASWLRRLQPMRSTVDIFPVVYGMNTPTALRRLFPDSSYTRIVYTHPGVPSYAGSSRVLWWFFNGLNRVLPRTLDPMLHIFVRKAK
jgi:ubiquinone/menaquinone biosynthesis C-methylase UbiE